MQGKIIAEQILLDAKELCDKIVSDSKIQIDKERKEYLDYKLKESEQNSQRLMKKLDNMQFEYSIKKNAEAEKRLYKRQQSIIFDIKNETKQAFNNLDIAKKLNFIEKVLSKYSEEGEEVLFKMQGITLDQVKSLASFKKNHLKIKEGTDEGLIIIGDLADKNFLLDTIVDEAFSKCEGEISKLLF